MNNKKIIALLIITNLTSIACTSIISRQSLNIEKDNTKETTITETVIESQIDIEVEEDESYTDSTNEKQIPKELEADGWRIGGEFNELYVKDIEDHVIADNDYVKLTYDKKIEYHKELNSLIIYFIMENKTERKIDMSDDGLEMNGCMLDVETYAESNKLAKAKCKMYIDAESIIDFDLTKLGEITGSMRLDGESIFDRIATFDISIKL